MAGWLARGCNATARDKTSEQRSMSELTGIWITDELQETHARTQLDTGVLVLHNAAAFSVVLPRNLKEQQSKRGS